MSNEIQGKFYENNPSLPIGDHEYEWTPEMTRDLQRCKKDILYFAENYYYILTLDKGEMVIPLYDCQKRAITSMIDSRFFVLMAPRQCGKTTMFGLYALHLACFSDNQRILIVANKGETAREIFTRIKDAYIAMPNWLKPSVKAIGKEHLELANGSKIHITRTTANAARGKTINLLIIDEMAFIEPGLMEAFWRSTYPVISSSESARILCSSTPNGTKNIFYERWKDAMDNKSNPQADNKSWKCERIYWREIPGRDEEWKRRTIADIGSIERFKQEFDCEFLDLSASAVSDELNQFIMKTIRKPLFSLLDDSYRIYEEYNKHNIYLMGVDVADGIGKDSTCVQILDVTDIDNIKQVAVYNNNKVSPVTFTPLLHQMLLEWGSPPVAIERNNMGAEVVSRIMTDYNYTNLVDWSYKNDGTETRRGVITQTASKDKGVANLRYWLHEAKRTIIYDEETLMELRAFVKVNGKWGARDARIHDDRVMALTWALVGLHRDIIQNHFKVLEYDMAHRPKKIDYISGKIERSFNMPKPEAGETRVMSYDPFLMDIGGNAGEQGNRAIAALESQGYKIVEQKNKYGVDMSYFFN